MNWLTQRVNARGSREGEALLYGVVLFTDAHANVRKVLQDQDYWDAFDYESGSRWAVFATIAARGTFGYRNFPLGTLGMMVSVRKEPVANHELLEDFGLSSTQQLPVLMVFAYQEDGGLRSAALALDDTSMDAAYNSLKRTLRLVSDTLDRVDDENLQSSGAFDSVQYAVKGYNEKKAIVRAVSVIERLKSLVS